MTGPGILQYDSRSFDLKEANLYGIFEPQGYMEWYIEMFPPGQDNYIMFNGLVFDRIYSPRQLSEITFDSVTDPRDLYDHTIQVNGKDRFMQFVKMSFKKWDDDSQAIELKGHGIIEADGGSGEMIFTFKAQLKFSELNLFETTRDAVQEFIDKHLHDYGGKLETNFETTGSGFHAKITGDF